VNQDKHYAFVTFAVLEDAQMGKTLGDGVTLDGRPMRVNWGKNDKNAQLQQQQAQQQQQGQDEQQQQSAQ
jgi:hypothetical protein